MTRPVIQVENLSKQYRIGVRAESYGSLRESLTNSFSKAMSRRRRKNSSDSKEIIWALKSVSFEVNQGEVVGIIGRNGAGKSTLLKILSRITKPTEGSVWLRGRVGSLLEVGTGFHPELTGRENIYLNGAILGMSRTEIDRKFDEIVAFSEIEKFLDTPVKRYSSGMYVRLAFAVAAHLEPEILLVDEVLAVGDAAFQKKCLGKMGEVAEGGRTVLFVSHNMGAVRSLCKRGILLKSGMIEKDDEIESVVDDYLATVNRSIVSAGDITWELQNAPGDSGFHLLKIELLNHLGEKQSVFIPQESINIHIHYQLSKSLPGLRIVLQVRTANGEIAFATTDHSSRQNQYFQPGNYTSICHIPTNLMNLGDYFIRLHAGIPDVMFLLKPDDFIKFAIVGIGNQGSTFQDRKKWPGVVCPKIDWEIIENTKKTKETFQ